MSLQNLSPTDKTAARFAMAALTSMDARHPDPIHSAIDLMSPRILGGGTSETDTGATVALHGLDLLAPLIALGDLPTDSPSRQIAVAKLIRSLTANPAAFPQNITSTLQSLRPPQRWTIDIGEIRRLKLSIQASSRTPGESDDPTPKTTGSAPAQESLAGAPTSQAPAAITPSSDDLSRPPPPLFRVADVNLARLAGTDAMFNTATKGTFPSASALFHRLEEATLAAHALYQARGLAAPPAIPATTASPSNQRLTWRRVSTRLAERFSPGNITQGAVPGLDLRKFLTTPLDLWLPSHPVDTIPGMNSDYRFDALVLAQLIGAITQDFNAMLVGPSGCGKTTVIEQAAARLGRPYVRIPVDGEMRRREILGGWLQKTNSTGSYTDWQDGLLTTAFQAPTLVCLDEIDRSDPDLIYAIHQALERTSFQIVDRPGTIIERHAGCRLFGTANTRGAGDAQGLYSIKTPMSEASRNRFTYFIDTKYLSPQEEGILLHARCPHLTPHIATLICLTAADLRQSLQTEAIRTCCSTRQVLDIGQDIAFWSKVSNASETALARASFGRIMQSRAVDEADEMAIAGLLDARLGAQQ